MESLFDSSGNYRTDTSAATSVGRHMPSAWFYAKLYRCVSHAARHARQGTLTLEVLFAQSHGILQALEETGARLEFTGGQYVRELQGPCVFVSNHMSSLETLILPALLLPHGNVTFIVKEKLLRYPLIGDILRHMRAIIVGQESPLQDLRSVIAQGGQHLRDGVSVVVFPEGTRNRSFQPSRFNSLGVKLAKREGVPVVPLALRTDAWGQGKVLREFGRIQPELPVHFAFGAPMAIEGSGAEQHQAVIEFISGSLSRWEVEVITP